MLTILYTILAIGAFIFIMNSGAFRKIWNSVRAQLGKFGSIVESRDPMAMHNQAVEDAAAQLEKEKNGLTESLALVKQFEREVKQGQEDKIRLESRIEKALANGDPNNSAKEYALQLGEVESLLEVNKKHLTQHQNLYDSHKQRILNLGQKIKDIQQKAKILGNRLQVSERTAKLTHLLQSFDSSTGDTLKKTEDALQQRIDSLDASAQVSEDLNPINRGIEQDMIDERDEEANAILARFKKPTE